VDLYQQIEEFITLFKKSHKLNKLNWAIKLQPFWTLLDANLKTLEIVTNFMENHST